MKNVTILALGMLITQLSFAQEEFRFGLKGQANLGWMSGTNKSIDNDGVKVGFAYGVMGDYYFRSNYGVSAELLLSNVKTQFNLTSDQSFVEDTSNTVLNDLNYSYNVQYLEIPISLKFRTKEIGNITYWGNFGFSPGFALNARTSITSPRLPRIIADEDPTDFKVNDNEGDDFAVNDFDDKVFLFRFPVIIGGGVEYKMAGSTSIQGGIRFANTFTDIFVKDNTADAKNNYFAISTGVLF
ncbi:PorT family protein [Bacteroidia bacterium]|nr:PorT family protein [Bacteroidia bacterium]MDB9881672.1 PorT family protein [Bacteroidia bacterium]MDC1395398.1 PorT family protein [Bacteroidia bacterium]